jgi:zinc protease
MGRIVDRDSMAVAWIHSAGVHQMTGYAVSTWFGYGGWGVHDYFFLGRHDFAESFFLNNQALVHELVSRFPATAATEFSRWDLESNPGLLVELAEEHGLRERDEIGLLWDRDTVAFYGDPAWVARIDRQTPVPYVQDLTERDGVFTFEVSTVADGEWGRPPAQLLPRRMVDAVLVEGRAVVTDDFVMLPLAGKFRAGEVHRASFRSGR